MRVDWSKNLLNDPYSLAAYVQAVSGAPYYVQEHELGAVLLREGHAVGEGVACAVREVGGDEDLLHLDHDPPPREAVRRGF